MGLVTPRDALKFLSRARVINTHPLGGFVQRTLFAFAWAPMCPIT